MSLDAGARARVQAFRPATPPPAIPVPASSVRCPPRATTGRCSSRASALRTSVRRDCATRGGGSWRRLGTPHSRPADWTTGSCEGAPISQTIQHHVAEHAIGQLGNNGRASSTSRARPSMLRISTCCISFEEICRQWNGLTSSLSNSFATLARTRVSGSSPSGRNITRLAAARSTGRAFSSARQAASRPAASPSKQNTTSGARARELLRCSAWWWYPAWRRHSGCRTEPAPPRPCSPPPPARDPAARCLARLIQAVQLAPLLKDRGLRRVQVLRCRAVAQHASAESYDSAARIVDGKHDAIAESVVELPPSLLDQQPCGDQLLACSGIVPSARVRLSQPGGA